MANKGALVTYIDVANRKEENCVIETGSIYDSVVKNVIEFIKDGQIVVFFPACFAEIHFLKDIQERNIDITVCEAVSFIYVCELKGKDSLNIQCKKSNMKIAVRPSCKTKEIINMLNQYFEVMVPAQNLLETSMDNMNITLHLLPILLNITAVENDVSTFYHYTGGVSPTIGRLMKKIDNERLQIGEAFGLDVTSAYDQLIEFYGDRNLHSLEQYVSQLWTYV